METKYSSPVISVGPEASIFETLQKMQLNFVKRIVIVSKERPIGIVTERDVNKFLENDKTAKVIDEIPIKLVMQKNLISISDGLEDHFDQCASRMETFQIGSVVLVDKGGKPLGIVSRTDIASVFSSVFGGKYLVKDYMTKKVVTCRKSDSLKFALKLMNNNEVSRLIVTDETGHPLGLITTNTFLTHSDYFTKGNTRTRNYLLSTKDEKLSVGDILKQELLTIEQDEDLAIAAGLMIKNKISGIPIIDNKKDLLGIITKTDVVSAFTVVVSHQELRKKYREIY